MMKTTTIAFLVGAGLLGACAGDGRTGDDDGVDGPELLDGFEPDPPGEGEVQIIAPIVRDIAPGADVTLCTYLPLDVGFADTQDIVAGTGFQSRAGSHHAILYTVERNRPVDTHECTDDDMVNSRYLVGAGGGDVGGGTAGAIPPGIAYRIQGGKQLMVQTHWINTTTQPIDGQAAFNLKVQPPSDSVQIASLFSWLTTNISVPPNGIATAHGECVVQRQLKFYQIIGHAHEHGTHVSLSMTRAGGASETLYDYAWTSYMAFDPPRLNFPVTEPLTLEPGDTLSVDCEYANDTADELVFPREMCVGAGYFFPADVQINCADNDWPDGQ